MSKQFVSDPHDVVRSGEVVKVKVMEVDVERQRIGLSLRLDDEPGQGPKRGGGKSAGKPGGKQRRGGKGRGGVDKRGAQGGSMADALKRAGFGK